MLTRPESVYERVKNLMGERYVWASKGRHDFDACSLEDLPLKDHDHFEPLQPRLTDRLHLRLIDGRERGDPVSAPRWVPSKESESVGPQDLRCELVATHYQKGSWSYRRQPNTRHFTGHAITVFGGCATLTESASELA